MKRGVVVAAILLIALALVVLWRRARAPAEVRFPEVVDAILARVDTDKDGVVSADEYARTSLPDEPIQRYDSDGDGRISRLELEQGFLHTSPTALGRERLNRSRGDATPLSR